jgi:hypothetical protein
MSEKVVPAANYQHSATARTITFSGDYTTLTEENIIKITDLITGDLIYDSNNPTQHATSDDPSIQIAESVLTYQYRSLNIADADKIQVRIITV